MSTITMKLSDAGRAVTNLLGNNLSMLLWGQPGVGKSSIVKQIAKDKGMDLVDVRATLLDPVDLRGIPSVNGKTKVTEWCPPSFLPRSGKGIIFLDEIGQAPPLVQAACLQLVLDRQLGEYKVPDGWDILAASNRSEDKAGVSKIITPLANRFIHINVVLDQDDWNTWAITNGISSEIRSFIKFKPSVLNTFNPKESQIAFATPRSWEFADRVYKAIGNDISQLSPILAGTVGNVSSEFIAFLKTYKDLPDIDYILKNPEKATIPEDKPSVMYALCGALVEKIRNKDENIPAFMEYVSRWKLDEFRIIVLKDATSVNIKVTDDKKMSEILRKSAAYRTNIK